ncbi:MAG: hypothetical protein JST75_14350 [Bacteroidetes bacterium]|nr:hypothetical protein [Bacteroidota bacterium]
MKKRIFSGWNFRRVIYLLLGGIIIVQAIMEREWIGILFGAYLASMGVFAFGCAGGNCFGANCYLQRREEMTTQVQDLNFEEIKSKSQGNI